MYLSRLRLKDFALVSEIDVEFPKGIIALTGETGAGKSTVLGAIQLLLGERADTSQIRHACKKAVVEGAFEIGKDHFDCERLATWRAEGFQIEDGEELIVRREIGEGGRGAAFFAGCMVTVRKLAELMGETVDIHSQNAQQSLTKRAWQRLAYDSFAGTLSLAEETSKLYENFLHAKKELTAHLEKERETRRQEDLLRFQIKEVEEAKLKPGEEAELLEAEKRLSHAEETGRLLSALEEGLGGEGASPVASLKQLNRYLRQLAAFFAPAEGWEEQMQSALASLDDLASEISRAAEKNVVDPEALGNVQARLELLESLKKKYGDSIEKILEETEAAKESLERSGSFEERRTFLENRIKACEADYFKAAEKLSAGRAKAAKKFSKAMEGEMQPLGLGTLRFEVALEKLEDPSAFGLENPEFLIANAGQPLMPLSRVASGGELSRLTLALKQLALGGRDVQILFFDEIDAGISATVAGAIGKKMRLLGKDHQVFVITHMPVIAAAGDSHFTVVKSVNAGETYVTVEKTEGKQRLSELARMLGDREQASLEYAEKLLRNYR